MQFSLVLCLGLLMGLCGFAHGAVSKVKQSFLAGYAESRVNSLIPEPLLRKQNTIYFAAQTDIPPSSFTDSAECARNRAMMFGELGHLTFAEAAPLWLQSRTKIAEGTRLDYLKNFKRMMPFFGPLKLSEIHIGHIYSYREQRQLTAGPSRINHEISTLQQILKRAGLWEEIKKWYEPLPLPEESSGIALTEDEERYFFRVASQRSKWMVAYLCELLSRNTAAGPKEIRRIKLGRIDFDRRILHIDEGVKNHYRPRSIPLNDAAFWAVSKLAERAFERGSIEPEHYLLPARIRAHESGFDPDKPMTSWKTAHRNICAEVAKKFPRLAKFHPYDWRHTACTVMLENPSLSYGTIERIMGHRLGSRTKEKYSHIRDEALRKAAEALNSQPNKIEPYGAPQWMRKVRTIRG